MKFLLQILTTGFFILAVSCNNQKQTNDNESLKGHLPANLVDNPRTLDKNTVSLSHDLGKLSFTDTLHNFGKIAEGESVTYDFEFTNTGAKDILIYEAKASCGCTVPEYPKEPVKNAEKNIIKVTFNSQGKNGYNEKAIIISTNGNPAVYTLHILAEVE